jgi:hypothetical protein
MKPAEKKLAAMLLRMAADTYSNHGCNDMPREVIAKFTPEEQAELAPVYNEFMMDDDPDHEGDTELRSTMDWLWMDILAKKLEQETA